MSSSPFPFPNFWPFHFLQGREKSKIFTFVLKNRNDVVGQFRFSTEMVQYFLLQRKEVSWGKCLIIIRAKARAHFSFMNGKLFFLPLLDFHSSHSFTFSAQGRSSPSSKWMTLLLPFPCCHDSLPSPSSHHSEVQIRFPSLSLLSLCRMFHVPVPISWGGGSIFFLPVLPGFNYSSL